MYEEFLRDPAAVGAEWRRLFESGVVGERPGQRNGTARAEHRTADDRPPPCAPRPPASPPAPSPIKGPAARAGAEHGGEPHRPHRHDLPRAAGRHPRGPAEGPSTRRIQAAGQNVKISFTHIIAWAIVQATKQHPVMGHSLLMKDGTPYRVVPEASRSASRWT